MTWAGGVPGVWPHRKGEIWCAENSLELAMGNDDDLVVDCAAAAIGHTLIGTEVCMKQVHVTTRSQWRRWLAQNHHQEKDGIWLVFHKKETGRPSLEYEESVEEALCFGWIDSLIKKIDDHKYCRKFTPRKDDSGWSNTNKRRVQKIIQEGKMTEFGLAKVEAAKRSGRWERDPRPVINLDVPRDLSEALARNTNAKDFFEKLAPAYRKQFIGWIVTAKRPETRAKRLEQCLALLAKGEKLGLK
ncbi:conserved hypothetical protein [Verrucomicrobia bacterium]|nr:conserved hypothetical protein [Verrucomicrobiota bacterium]